MWKLTCFYFLQLFTFCIHTYVCHVFCHYLLLSTSDNFVPLGLFRVFCFYLLEYFLYRHAFQTSFSGLFKWGYSLYGFKPLSTPLLLFVIQFKYFNNFSKNFVFTPPQSIGLVKQRKFFKYLVFIHQSITKTDVKNFSKYFVLPIKLFLKLKSFSNEFFCGFLNEVHCVKLDIYLYLFLLFLLLLFFFSCYSL